MEEGETSSDGVDIRDGFVKEANLVGVVAPKQFKSTQNLANPFESVGIDTKNYGEIELAGKQVKRGLVILKAGKKKEETPTHDIRAISFQDHSMSYKSKQISIKNKTVFDSVRAQSVLTLSLTALYKKKLRKNKKKTNKELRKSLYKSSNRSLIAT